MEIIGKHLSIYLRTLLLFTLFFWFWALQNTKQITDGKNYDFGLVSFGSVIMTTCYVLGMTNHAATIGSWAKGLALTSHCIVALNYTLGVYVGYTMLHRPGFALYCFIFIFLWLTIATLTYYGINYHNENHVGASSTSSATCDNTYSTLLWRRQRNQEKRKIAFQNFHFLKINTPYIKWQPRANFFKSVHCRFHGRMHHLIKNFLLEFCLKK